MKVSFRFPLVIMTPKSLLRHPKVISPVSDLVQGTFQEVLDDSCDPELVNRVLLCSGKVYYELLAYRQTADRSDTALIRVEQLYPFCAEKIGPCLGRYPQVSQITWVQEEPRNYGAWTYMRERFSSNFPPLDFHYCGRPENASIATGSFKHYQQEQKKLIEDAFATSFG